MVHLSILYVSKVCLFFANRSFSNMSQGSSRKHGTWPCSSFWERRSGNVDVPDSGTFTFPRYKISSKVPIPVPRPCSLVGTWLLRTWPHSNKSDQNNWIDDRHMILLSTKHHQTRTSLLLKYTLVSCTAKEEDKTSIMSVSRRRSIAGLKWDYTR